MNRVRLAYYFAFPILLLCPAPGGSQPAHTNRLINEKSPYLLQHAHNPVDWRPWGQEAFDEAKRRNKPIFLSVGYSTCHWCHVMERESFENEKIAAIMNENFICIKVDREERPDIDAIYMAYVEAATGGGGWPMSVWLTPDLKPFVGGTYFPPEDRDGRAGFITVLHRIAEAWNKDPGKLVRSGDKALEQLRKETQIAPGKESGVSMRAVEAGFSAFHRMYDGKHGGFGGAPKFPRPVTYNFLLRYYDRTRNKDALDMVVETLHAMAKGGIDDQLGGGLHRYSVDESWFTPHFEKMLYDQAQLAVSYLEAFQITGDRALADAARAILDYTLRDMLDPDGGFYSAEDADSATDPAKPEERSEGAYYVWTQAEIEKTLGSPASDYLCYAFGVKPDGNVREDPRHELSGKNILFQAHSTEDMARHFKKPAAEMAASIEESKKKLLARRVKRVRPRRDDKVLTAWNGLMISALAKAGAILSEPRYSGAARRTADFLLARMYDSKSGVLLRRYRQHDTAIPGFLSDYAFLAQGLLDLYESGFHLPYLQAAIRLTERQMELFEDKSGGGFFSTAAGDANLLVRLQERYDDAEPSGNAVAACNLLRLAQMTDRKDLRDSADRVLRSFTGKMAAEPSSAPQMLVAYEFSLSKPKQIVLVGSGGLDAMLHELNSRFVPHKIVLLVDGEPSRNTLAAYLPVLGSMTPKDGKATAYVCENYACKLPTADPRKFAELLQMP
jgi:uncharacterized protein YyaL (SSP411 family)